MSVSNLTGRRVAVGQPASVVFRRLYVPVACATNERSERLQRPGLLSRPTLREAPKIKSNLVATRLEPSPVELESTEDTTPLTEEGTLTEGATVTKLAEKTFHFEDTDETELHHEITQTEPDREDLAKYTETELEASDAAVDLEKEERSDVDIVKAPSPMESKSAGGPRAAPASKAIGNDSLFRRLTQSGTTDRPAEKESEEKPKVIVAKRPILKPKQPEARPKAARMDNVLVVWRTPRELVSRPPASVPRRPASNGNASGMKRPPGRVTRKPVQPRAASKQANTLPVVPKAVGAIERPRPKAAPKPSPLPKPDLKLNRPVAPVRNRPAVRDMKRPPPFPKGEKVPKSIPFSEMCLSETEIEVKNRDEKALVKQAPTEEQPVRQETAAKNAPVLGTTEADESMAAQEDPLDMSEALESSAAVLESTQLQEEDVGESVKQETESEQETPADLPEPESGTPAERPEARAATTPSPPQNPVLKLNKPVAAPRLERPSALELKMPQPLEESEMHNASSKGMTSISERAVEDVPVEADSANENEAMQLRANLLERAQRLREELPEERETESDVGEEIKEETILEDPQPVDTALETLPGLEEEPPTETPEVKASRPSTLPKPVLKLNKPAVSLPDRPPAIEVDKTTAVEEGRPQLVARKPDLKRLLEVEDATVEEDMATEKAPADEESTMQELKPEKEGLETSEREEVSEEDVAERQKVLQVRSDLLEKARRLHKEEEPAEAKQTEEEADVGAEELESFVPKELEGLAEFLETPLLFGDEPSIEEPEARATPEPASLPKPALKLNKPAMPARPSRPSPSLRDSRLQPVAKSPPRSIEEVPVVEEVEGSEEPAPLEEDPAKLDLAKQIQSALSEVVERVPEDELAQRELLGARFQKTVSTESPEEQLGDTTQTDLPASEDTPELDTTTTEESVAQVDPAEIDKNMEIRTALLEEAHRLQEDETESTQSPSQSLPAKPPTSDPKAPRSVKLPPPKLDSGPVKPAISPPGSGVSKARDLAASDSSQDEDGMPSLMKPPKKVPIQEPSTVEVDRQFFQHKAEKAKEDKEKAILEAQQRREQTRLKRIERIAAKRDKRSDPMLIESRRKARQERQTRRKEAMTEAEREVIIEVGPEGMSVEDLANLLATDPTEVMKALFLKGIMVTVNQTLDLDTVRVVAAEMGVDVVDRDEAAVTEMAKKEESFCEEDDENAIDRPPVVTVMGHVDHGKTSLLDYIRRSQVVAGEAGGITQAIGAYTCSVEVEGEDRMICFLDTPGHEAFGAMRARGTRVTDIAVIVIAANDGIRPQTLEAISHANAAKVPIVVAINKIDVEGADPERVKRELSEIELLPEEWGGKTPVVEISAKNGTGIQELLEMLSLVADIQLNLRANPEVAAKGTVIEAYVEKRSGVVATLLIQNGTLHVGDALVAGGAFGKVRSLTNELEDQVDSAGPSIAVQMLGFHEIPAAGDVFSVCLNEAEAKAEAEAAAEEIRLKHLSDASGGGSMVTLSSLASVDDEDANALQRVNLVLKADTSGSLEAVKGALAKLPQEAVVIRYLHTASGEVTESDVLLAAAAEGMIVCFNAPVSESVKSIAKQRGVEMQNYSVIYDLIDDVRAVMEGRLSPVKDRLPIGQAEVRAVFGAGSRCVAGCMVTEGRLEKDCIIRVLRKKSCTYEGPLTSLRRVKDDVEEVSVGLECGVGCDDHSEWQEGDLIEAFTLIDKRMTLEESHATMAVDETELQGLIQ